MKGPPKVGLIVALLCVSTRCLSLADDLPKDSEKAQDVQKREVVISSSSLGDFLPDKLTEICQVCRIHSEPDKEDAVTCPPSYQRNPHTNTCLRMVDTHMTWDGAKKFCESDGESLATFETLESVFWLISLRKTNPAWRNYDAWIGGRLTKGAWRWTGRSTGLADTLPWCDGEPNDLNNEECLSSRAVCDFQLNDEQCGFQLLSICEKK